MMRTMGRNRSQQTTADLFSTASVGDTSPPPAKQVMSAQERRHILPDDLPNAVKHLSDRELDVLITVSLEEAKRRGRAPAGVQAESVPNRSSPTGNRRQVVATVSLTRGQINAVRAAFKAGIKPSLIARQFGLSQSDVRKVLASDTAT
jgi:hypothetical protein